MMITDDVRIKWICVFQNRCKNNTYYLMAVVSIYVIQHKKNGIFRSRFFND